MPNGQKPSRFRTTGKVVGVLLTISGISGLAGDLKTWWKWIHAAWEWTRMTLPQVELSSWVWVLVLAAGLVTFVLAQLGWRREKTPPAKGQIELIMEILHEFILRLEREAKDPKKLNETVEEQLYVATPALLSAMDGPEERSRYLRAMKSAAPKTTDKVEEFRWTEVKTYVAYMTGLVAKKIAYRDSPGPPTAP